MKLKKFGLFLLVLLLAAAGCVPTATQPQAGEPGANTASVSSSPVTITRAITSEPSGLDPHGPAGSGQNVILPYLFDTLVYRDSDNTYQPYLAESWGTSEDGKQVTFKLRKGILFHDGTALDAEAVKFNFDRYKELGSSSPVIGTLADVELIDVLDPQTVRFNFPEPTTTLLSTLSTPYAGIVSPKAAQESGDGFAQKPVGSGPFMFEKWVPGVSVTLVKNPNYAWAPPVMENQGVPSPDELVFKIIPDVSSQLTAFQAGEVDIMFVNSPGHVAKLKQDPNTNLIETTLNSLIYLGYNCQKAPFDDVKVRQALSHAVNKDELLQTALGGIGQVAFAPLAPTLPGFDPSLKSSELGFDLDQAKSLLQEAGFEMQSDAAWAKDGAPLKVTLLTSTRPPNPALATVLQAQLKTLGVTVEIQQLDSSAAITAATQGDYDLLLWRYDWNDADVLSVYLSSDRIGRTNRNFYKNAQVDDLLAQGLHEQDDAKRNALYLQAQQIILQDAPWQPLYSPTDFIAIRKDVSGVVVGAMGRLMMNDATKTVK